jgi:hypothetical protein
LKKQIGLIGLIALVCVFGSCLVVSAQIIKQQYNIISLNIEVLPNGTFNPQDICDSRPLNLRFQYNKGGIQFPTNVTYSLRSLEYSIKNENENDPFFKDVLYLNDNTLPKTINVSPGIYIPTNSTKIRVEAKLFYYTGTDKIAEAQTEVNVTTPMLEQFNWIERYYDRMRDGYIRRHILAEGRGLSSVWLKEYEPCVDSKELLYQSRTEKVEGRTRVYVPWIAKCVRLGLLPAVCGNSVEEGSSIIYGGDENPLLRGGLAMATFALEYIAYQRPDSLEHAMKLFEYTEKSEWRDPTTNQLTGFFLRSRWPGNVHETGKEYFFASTDEISGMSLGMLYLSNAINIAILYKTPGLDLSKVMDVRYRIRSLTDRLASQLRNNFYLIVPLKREGNTWKEIGLPLQRQKGWAGTYPFEWFFSRGFRSITGNDYSVSSNLFGDLPEFIDKIINIPETLNETNIYNLDQGVKLAENIISNLNLQVSSYTRALTSIQVTGITMYYRGQDFEIPIPCWFNKTIHIPEDTMPRYNYAMLLHAYQLGMADDPNPGGEAYKIKREMARLVNAVLGGGATTNLYIPDFVKDTYIRTLTFLSTGQYIPGIEDVLCSTLCDCSPPVWIGSRGEDYNILDTYSAAVAIAFRLPSVFSDDSTREKVWERINHALGYYPYAQNLPVSERTYDESHPDLLGVNVINHNPSHAWSTAFGWEHYSAHIMGGGSDRSNGLDDSLIAANYRRSPEIDSMIEGAGLDVLLPWSLYFALNPDFNINPTNRDFMRLALHNYGGPYLRACTTNPVALACSSPWAGGDYCFVSKCTSTYEGCVPNNQPHITVTDPIVPNNDHQVPFVSITQGTLSDQVLTLTSSGTSTLVIGSIGGTNPLATPFSKLTDNCSGKSLVPGGTCIITIRFSPTAVGDFSDSFDIPSNDPDTPTVTVKVSGTAVTTGTIPLGVALDNTILVWTTGGNAPFTTQTTNSYSGGSAAQTGKIGNNQSTYLATSVTGPGTLSFYWKASSEENYDIFAVYLDGVMRYYCTGDGPWYRTELSIPAGNHTVKWVYVKDDLVASGQDAGWVDDVVFAPAVTHNAFLYFPHIDTNLPWQTEIAIINTSNQTVTGTLRALSNAGQPIGTKAVTLTAHGRKQITVANEFTNHTNIGYIIFDTDSTAVQGYTKFYQAGKYRSAIPAVKEMNTSDIYISHIASNADWWTGVSLVNTTSETKELTMTFSNGQTRNITLNANEHKAFSIRSLFNDQPQPGIESAVITHASGVIGLELFGSSGWGTQLEGILLTDKTTSTIYYPHVASDDSWWTGIVAYNPSASTCTITITPYSAQGTALSSSTFPIAGKGKYVGVVTQLGLPAQTAWFKIDSTNNFFTGFELFGTTDGQQLGAYAGGSSTCAKMGVFPKIEKNGWTGIAFVNTVANAASVTLSAYNDAGSLVATEVLPVAGHAKMVKPAEDLFTQDISGATYIAYSSDRNVVGFQLNGSADGTMLDGLPALAGTN